MAICRPKAIAAAPVFGPQHSGGRRRETFFGLREEWAKPRGKKSLRRRCGTGDRGLPSFGQIKPSEATWLARSDSSEEKTRRTSNDRTGGQPRQAKEERRW